MTRRLPALVVLSALRLEIPDGWTSVHRDPDAFDLGRPDPDRDAPLVAVVFMTPEAPDAAGALDAIEAGATGRVRRTPGSIGSLDADGLEVTGGSGQLVASAYGSIALDAQPTSSCPARPSSSERAPHRGGAYSTTTSTRWNSFSSV